LQNAIEADLQVTITSAAQIDDLVQAAKRCQKTANVHLKVDTGMHRLGAPPHMVPDLLNKIATSKGVRLAGIFSHLAQADDAAITGKQNRCFAAVLKSAKEHGASFGVAHLASGDAARYFPETHYDMVRPGLLLYGLEPKTVSEVVQPAMSVRARINHMRDVEAGDSVGYNLTWTAERPSRLASIPVGYADGIDRGLSNRMTALLAGKEINQVGLISMDQMLLDITDVPEAQEGDVVTLIGSESNEANPQSTPKTLHLATWANTLNTITYELACRLRARMPRIYTRHS
jgi:alanine racemase